MALAADAAHGKDVVHRDLKPQNVMVQPDGEPMILDFGIAFDRTDADPTLTRPGFSVGTPAYMSPEQIRHSGKRLDGRSDVFSLGVMLWECLTLERPWVGTSTYELLQRIQSEEVANPRRLNPAISEDLRAVLERALEKDPRNRYATAADFADDLQRLRTNRTVKVRRVGTTTRAYRWVRRNPVPSFAIAALVAGVVGTTWGFVRFWQRNSEFDQLAGVVLYDRAVECAQNLYPPWPDKIAALKAWLREDCGKLLAKREEIEGTVRDLRKRALRWTEAEKQHDLDTHPRLAEWRQAEQKLSSLRRAEAIRDGAPLALPELSAEQRLLDMNALHRLAWDRVAPKAEERKVYGEEALGLVCARAAVAKATDAERFQLLDTLAWALLMNGQDAEAKLRSGDALATAPDAQKAAYQGYLHDIEQAVSDAAKTLTELEASCAALDTEVHARQTWTFAEEAPRFLYDTLSALLGKLASLEAGEKASVEQRLRWANAIEAVSIEAHRAHWEAARAAIKVSERYRSSPIDLRPQMGLVPIGQNPVTGLWEFYELRSAWDGSSDPTQIEIPTHDDEGRIPVTADTGVVFVLLPGGTFAMGSQKDDSAGANYDEQREGIESLFEVTLEPFLLARHELTQVQWRRLTGEDPSYYKAGQRPGDVALITAANPVEQISWEDCERWLPRYGLELPSEAQWEYGCRAGTSTPWTCAPDDLQNYANLADATVKRFEAGLTCEDWSDDHFVHAPAGTFRANDFGLFDVHGNVWEWTRDGNFTSVAPRAGDGLRGDPSGSPHRVSRGGSFGFPARGARSALRRTVTAAYWNIGLGARAARLIQP